MDGITTFRSRFWTVIIPILLLASVSVLVLSQNVYVFAAFALADIFLGMLVLYTGFQVVRISEYEVGIGTLIGNKVDLSEVESCKYKLFHIGFSNERGFFNNFTFCTFELKKKDRKLIAGITSETGINIPRYGRFPAERRALFTKLQSVLRQRGINMDQKTQQKLTEAATK